MSLAILRRAFKITKNYTHLIETGATPSAIKYRQTVKAHDSAIKTSELLDKMATTMKDPHWTESSLHFADRDFEYNQLSDIAKKLAKSIEKLKDYYYKEAEDEIIAIDNSAPLNL